MKMDNENYIYGASIEQKNSANDVLVPSGEMLHKSLTDKSSLPIIDISQFTISPGGQIIKNNLSSTENKKKE